MSDFVQTMKDWQRMCNTFKSCDDCPMQKEDGWTYILCSEGGISSSRPEVAEKIIEKWAAEHPEPVYETWADYISRLVLHDICEGKISGPETVLTYAMKTPIPADIAQKLEIEPKEG